MKSHTALVDAKTAGEHFSDPEWLFVDCRFDIRNPARGPQLYRASHVKGAVYADLDRDLSGRIAPGVTGRHPLPEPDALARVFSRWGIGSRTQVVAYDESTGAMAAARLWWLLKWAGHNAVAVLEGGLNAWIAAGLPCMEGAESGTRRPSVFLPALDAALALDAGQVRAVLGNPAWAVLDARAADRFRGENETIDPVAGHIDGAISAPYAAALGQDGFFKPVPEVAQLYKSLMGGRDAAHTVIYCGSGVTAAHGILACAHAGLGMPRLYPGSWSEWITDPGRPVAR
jgi:thiosulfate/3-mercaptopyruvate sulfurtransferase